MATDIIARGMITEYIAGTNINFTENRDGTVEISASGSISSEDSVARDAIGNHKSDTSNPHNVTPAQIGLGNVDNTSDLDKPISTAVQKAIDNKADKTVATTSADGLMSAEDKGKLDSADDTYALKSKYGDTTINVGRRKNAPIGDYSTSLGIGTVANGYASTAEGAGSQASELASHAGGYNSQAVKKCSFAHGYEVDANHNYETAFGKHNISNDDTLFSIGDGAEINTDGNISIARHNAFEITTTGGKLHDKDIATTENISNPNLLINPDFKINQRGGSNYSTDWVYTVDRWVQFGAVVSPNSSGGINISKRDETDYFGFIQRTEILQSDCNGKSMTLSAKINGEVLSGTIIRDDTEQLVFTIGESSDRFVISWYNNNDIKYTLVQLYSSKSYNIEWIKLEYGSIATPFFPPDPTTELLKCKRYFETKSISAKGLAPDDSWIEGHIFDVPKRAIPSISLTSLLGTPDTLAGMTGADSEIKIVGYPNVAVDRIHGSSCSKALGYITYNYCYTADAEIY